MINKNDLYDITLVFIKIRNDISNRSNIIIINQLLKALEDQNNTEDNQIRKRLSSIKELNYENWYFVYHNNIYANQHVLKNYNIYCLFKNLLNNLIFLLNQNEYEKAYDLIDSFHCLPNIVADNNFSIPKSFWKTYTKRYRNKWDRDFLRIEQRQWKKYSRFNIDTVL